MRLNINGEFVNSRLVWVGFVGSFFLGLFLLSGCGGPKKKIVEGSISVAGEVPDGGQVSFVPIESTTGPINVSVITSGRYRMEARGGVLPGTYRVELNASKKTGRQVMQSNGFEDVMSDEIVQISPPMYSGKQSPLKLEVTPDFEGRFDITIE